MGQEFVGAPTPFAAPAAGAVVIYRGATLFDGTASPVRTAMTIVVDGARIRAVIPDDAIPEDVLDGAEVIDLAGQFVIPGLIDSHQHIATPPNRAKAEATLSRHVYGGITAIRSMADDLRQVSDLARATLVGEIAGPDIHYAALMAGPSFFDDPRTWQVSQGETPGYVPWMQAITDESDLPLAVAMARGTHATAIKVYAALPAGTVAAIVTEAHRQGIDVWAHGTVFPANPEEVVAAGVDSVSHISLLAYQASTERSTSYKDKLPLEYDRFTDGDNPQMDSLFRQMRERGTILDATASMWTRDQDGEQEPEDEVRAKANAELSAQLANHAHRVGVPMTTGTDYESDPSSPYPALYDELAFLVERSAIPAADVLRSATRIGAMSLGAEDTMGTIEDGKLANFVVLSQDPLQDMANLRSIVFVIKRGLRYDRADYRTV